MAGCAGFGAVLPALLGLASDSPKEAPQLSERLLVVCGSVNPISVAQMAAAEAAGVARWQMTPEQKLQPDYWRTEKGQAEFAAIREGVARNNPYIIDTNDKERNRLTDEYAASHGIDIDGIRLGVSQSIGYLVGNLFTDPSVGTLLITGGDTLLQCMEQMGGPGGGAGAGADHRGGPLPGVLSGLHPLRAHQVRRLRQGDPGDGPCPAAGPGLRRSHGPRRRPDDTIKFY